MPKKRAARSNRPVRIALIGALGRMGREIIAAARTARDVKIIAGIEAPGHPAIGGEFEGIPISSCIADASPGTDCYVDFSTPAATLRGLRQGSDNNRPWVIGTTGFSAAERDKILAYGRRRPLLLAPNMSIGVNFLLQVVAAASEQLGNGYDVEILEMHHRHKKDAPSGTARQLVEIVRRTRRGPLVFGREGIVGPRPKDEIGVLSLRGGDVVGDHTVIFAAEGERLEFKHQATTRQAFARGVIQAVRFIVRQKTGVYSMEDVIRAL
jgi:4-hydroxy-tetrahydrodipicolinate reductase